MHDIATVERPAVSDELAALDPSRVPLGAESVTDQGAAAAVASPASGATDGDRSAAMGLSMIVVGTLAGAVAQRWPATAYTDAEKQSAALVLAPLFMKWGFNMPWFQKWREEAAALGTFAMLGLTGYQRVQAAPPPKPAAADPAAPAPVA